jgi:hypothetical protein
MRTSVAIAAAILFGCTFARSVQAAENQAYSGLYSVEVVDESGKALPTFEHLGRAYLLGTLGQRYLVRVINRSAQRVEVVTSVDGRDVLDGRPAAFSKRGYIVDAYGGLIIDGFRLNQEEVAAFRFSSVPRSYAAQMGSTRDVGVIGVAVFPERRYFRPPPVRRDPRVPVPQGDGDLSDSSAGVAGGVVGGQSPENKPPPSAEVPQPGGSISKKSMPTERRGLGTEFAEEHFSHVQIVHFERASSTPASLLSLRYDDSAGLLALGIDVRGGSGYGAGDGWLRDTAEPFRRNASFAQPPPGWRR